MADPFTRAYVLVRPTYHPTGYQRLPIDETAITYLINLLTFVKQRIGSVADAKELVAALKRELPDGVATMLILDVVVPHHKEKIEVVVRAVYAALLDEMLEACDRETHLSEGSIITCLGVNMALRIHSDSSILFADVLPPDALCNIRPYLPDRINKMRRPHYKYADTEATLKAAFPGRTVTGEAGIVSVSVVNYLQLLFAGTTLEKYEAWLDSLPGTLTDTNSDVVLYEKVMAVIVAGLKHWAPTGPLTYNHLVYAITQNPIHDLTPYLRTMEVE
ncbi:Hypothetical protein POVN_LOCUS491 [uncultured virus]|nr:Hypothetical protein POVN_LOCUS491 [uncultured virus]